jgi:hypothetical protein
MQVFVGDYLIYPLDNKLVYDINRGQNSSNLSTIIPAILVPLLVIIVALAALIIGVVIREKRDFEIIGEGRERFVVQVTLNIDNVVLLITFTAKPIVLQCHHFHNLQTCKSCVSTLYGH